MTDVGDNFEILVIDLANLVTPYIYNSGLRRHNTKNANDSLMIPWYQFAINSFWESSR